MKKQSIYLFICALASIFLFSCTQKTIKTEEKDYQKKFFLTTDTAKGALNIDIEVEIPVAFADSNVLKSIRKTIITNLFGPEYVLRHNDSIVALFAQELMTDYKETNAPLVNVKDSLNKYSFNNEHTLSGFSLLSDKKIYVYGIERYVDMGGAHGLETRNYYNFDLKTGNLITEKDIFKANCQLGIAELIKKRIIEDSKDSTDTEPIINIEDTDFWTDSIKPNGNFYITDEGINYVFNPYEIAPYYMGQTEVSIPYIRLKDFIKPNSVIYYLAEKQIKQ
ncbi:MAG: RsiV family protein [Paludibacter sp.]